MRPLQGGPRWASAASSSAAAGTPRRRRPPCTCPFTLLLRRCSRNWCNCATCCRTLLPLGFADPLEPHAPFGRQPVERHGHAAIDRDIPLDQSGLLQIRDGRPHRDVVAAQDVIAPNLRHPARVLPDVDHRVVRKQRVVEDRPAGAEAERKPGRDPDADEVLCIEIAEEILVGARRDEQVGRHGRADDADRRREDEVGLSVDRLRVVDRREHQPAIGDRQVPVSGDEQIAAGGPDVVRRHPDPVGLDGTPEAGPPGVVGPLP